MKLDPKLDCLQAGKHTWSSTGGGYWCVKCHIFVTDQSISQFRKSGSQLSLENILEKAADESLQWITQLHFWSRRANDL